MIIKTPSPRMASFSITRFRATPPPTHRRSCCCLSIRRHHHQPIRVRNDFRKAKQPERSLLKARETVKLLPALAPVLPVEDTPPRLAGSQAVGLVVASQANFMRVIVQTLPPGGGGRIGMELLCVVKAVLKKIKRRVMVGDRVLVGSIDCVDRRGMIEDVFHRKSETGHPPVANVDHLVVLFSMAYPSPDSKCFKGITRFLVEAESTGIPFNIAFNKSELASPEMISEWQSRLQNWGYEPIFCSVKADHGLDSLQCSLRGKTSVIVGPSGVGKSSLINAFRKNDDFVGVAEQDNWFDPILGSNWFQEQRVGKVSERSGRGKHTTRHVSLLPLSGGGFLADTPGLDQPSLTKVTKISLAQHFPEIQRMLKEKEPAKCSFKDCLHAGEQGCIVNGDWERYPNYLELLHEIKIKEGLQLRTLGTKREGDMIYKNRKGVEQAEPRLERKKYRRESRKSLDKEIRVLLDEYYSEND